MKGTITISFTFFWLAYCITSFFTWHQKNANYHLLGCTQTGLQGYPTISWFGLVHPITPDLCAAKRWASAYGTNEQPPGHRKDQRCFFSNATGHVILALISWGKTAAGPFVAAHNKAGVPALWLIEHWGRIFTKSREVGKLPFILVSWKFSIVALVYLAGVSPDLLRHCAVISGSLDDLKMWFNPLALKENPGLVTHAFT